MDQIKIPRHQGPDGQGLPRSVFEKLVQLISENRMDEKDLKKAIELCFSVSTEKEWNDIYAPALRKIRDSK